MDNGKIGDGSTASQIDYAKYYANENAADSKRTYSQIMDLDKYLKEINEGENKKEAKNRTKTAFQDPLIGPPKELRSKTQNIPGYDETQNGNFYGNKFEKDYRTGRNQENGDKKGKLDRARTKEPYSKEKNEPSSEKYQKKKRDLDKFLGDDDYSGNRLSKMSMKNRQINENYNRKLVDEAPKVCFEV